MAFRYTRPELQNGADEIIYLLGKIGNTGSFGRQRVAPPFTLFDSKMLYDAQPLLWDDRDTASASPTTTTSTHSTATASVTMSVAANEVGKRVRQTFQRFNYQPGKSLQILCTGRLTVGGATTGITSRMGYFDDDNGIYVAYDNGQLKFGIRSSTSGSPVETEVEQSQWNGDTLNSTQKSNRSGVTIDVTKCQIFWWDLEWLGVGSVRCGVVVDGEFILCHTFNHANSVSSVYMSAANLPVRYEIANDGTGGAESLEHICSTVILEGGQQELGVLRTKSTAGTHVDANTSGTTYATIGLRLKSTHLSKTVTLESFTMAASTATDFEWRLIWNPTIAGAFTYSDETNSACQTARGATANTVTGGTPLASGYVKSSNSSGAVTIPITNSLRLGASIAGVRDQLVLCVRPYGNNADIHATLNWRELS